MSKVFFLIKPNLSFFFSFLVNDIWVLFKNSWAFQVTQAVKNPLANAGDAGEAGSVLGSGKIPWRIKWQPTPGFLPGKSHGQRNLLGHSLGGHKELDTTE